MISSMLNSRADLNWRAMLKRKRSYFLYWLQLRVYGNRSKRALPKPPPRDGATPSSSAHPILAAFSSPDCRAMSSERVMLVLLTAAVERWISCADRNCKMASYPPKVLISYSHDSPKHVGCVLKADHTDSVNAVAVTPDGRHTVSNFSVHIIPLGYCNTPPFFVF